MIKWRAAFGLHQAFGLCAASAWPPGVISDKNTEEVSTHALAEVEHCGDYAG